MPLERLDHVNLRTAHLEEMIAWYGRVLDLHPGPRPDFPFGGAWLYIGDRPAIHLVEVAEPPAAVAPRIEHFAIAATGLRELLARLEAEGVEHSLDPVPGLPVVQVNLHDCDGNHIHIDFPAIEAEGLTTGPGRYAAAPGA